uniref:Extracellular globin n=1 Tax=Seepiophila jonesi TaxID=151527 RepID=A0A0S2MLN3_SEEJO|nr:hemoglobin subunit A1 [Seepiophila jonesi]
MKVPCILLVLLGAVAVATAEKCNSLERIKVKMQWAKAFGYGASRAKFGDALWTNVFNYAPTVRPIFYSVNSKDMKSPKFQAHVARVLGGLDRVISMLDSEPTLNADLAHLKSQHDPRELDPTAFVVFRQALIATVAGTFGVCFDVPAWQQCFNVIAMGITGSDIFA